MFSSFLVVQSLSQVWLFATPWTAALQASLSFTIFRSLLKYMSTKWCYQIISSSAASFSFYLPSFPASGSFPGSQLFASSGQKYQSFSFHISTSSEYSGLISLYWLIWSPCCPKDSQDSSPTPHFKSVNSSALSFLICVHDYWKNHSFDYMDPCFLLSMLKVFN